MIIYISVAAIFVTAIVIKLLMPVAVRLNLLDSPSGRKQHRHETPLIGGVAVFISFTVIVLLLPQGLTGFRSLFLGLFILVMMGLLDDFYDISPKLRLLVQFVCAALVVFPAHLSLQHLGHVSFSGQAVVLMPWVADILSLIFVVGFINAMNMLDGQDGLLGSIGIIQIGWFAYIAEQMRWYHSYHLLIVMIGCLVGFLGYNYRGFWRKYASVFLGDTGSTCLGFFTAFFALKLSQKMVAMPLGLQGDHFFAPVMCLWILAFPIFDMVGVIVRRLFGGQSPLKADRGHLHHILESLGLSVRVSTPVLYCFSFILGIFGVFCLQFGLTELASLRTWIMLLVAYILIVAVISRLLKKNAAS